MKVENREQTQRWVPRCRFALETEILRDQVCGTRRAGVPPHPGLDFPWGFADCPPPQPGLARPESFLQLQTPVSLVPTNDTSPLIHCCRPSPLCPPRKWPWAGREPHSAADMSGPPPCSHTSRVTLRKAQDVTESRASVSRGRKPAVSRIHTHLERAWQG